MIVKLIVRDKVRVVKGVDVVLYIFSDGVYFVGAEAVITHEAKEKFELTDMHFVALNNAGKLFKTALLI